MNKHDRLYAILQALLAFGFLLSMGVTVFIVGANGIMRFILFIQATFLFLCVLTLILRFATNEAGRVMTKVLNTVLLLYFPLGTALAIYGFLKVDKEQRTSNHTSEDIVAKRAESSR